MAKFSPAINALNAGEWSPKMSARQDLGGYAASASVCENFIPTIQGPVVKRGGTGFVRPVKNSADRTWLVPFVVSQTESYMLEFGDLYIRSFLSRSPTLAHTTLGGAAVMAATNADPCVVTLTPSAPGDGTHLFIQDVNGMTELNNRWYITANKSGSTVELQTIHGTDVDSTNYGTYSASPSSSASKPRERASPYSAANLVNSAGELNIDFVQFGTVMYLTHRDGTVPPQKLTLEYATPAVPDSGDVFTFSELESDAGPFLALNPIASKAMYVSAATGTITITITGIAPGFVAGDVGSIVRIDQELITSTNGWKTAVAYTAGEYIRSEGHEYVAATSATSGTKIPTHTSGTVNDGDGAGTGGGTGVDWTYVSSGYGIARITAQTGGTATAEVLTTFPQTLVGVANASSFWRRGAWSETNGYPVCVALWRERLCFGQGLRVDCSNASFFEDFSVDKFGEILTESAVSVNITSDHSTSIISLVSGQALAALTRGGEFAVDAASINNPFGPNNVRTSDETDYGSTAVRPVRVDNNVLFVQNSGKKVRSLQYSSQSGGFVAPDMTVRSAHITSPRITGMAWQDEPHQTLWSVRSDGQLLSFAFNQENEVRAWARHIISGTDAVVECVATMPSPSGDRDDVWVIVSRTVNGGTYRYIEYMQPEHETGGAQEDVTYADSMLSYDGSAVTTIYGFDHMEGETLAVLSDGAVIPDVVVSSGEVIIATAASVIRAGLRFSAKYATNGIDGGAGDGTSQGKTKRITDIMIRFVDTLGGTTGPSDTLMDDVPELNQRNPAVLMGSPPALFTGDAFVSWAGGYETSANVWYVNDTLFPATVCGLFPQITVQESR